MLKSEIISELKKKYPKIKKEILEQIFNIFLKSIKEDLKDNKNIEYRNFGSWSIKKIKAKYNARNPKTGEILFVPETKKITFKMSKNLKKKINEKSIYCLRHQRHQ